jgi:competence protein ComEC
MATVENLARDWLCVGVLTRGLRDASLFGNRHGFGTSFGKRNGNGFAWEVPTSVRQREMVETGTELASSKGNEIPLGTFGAVALLLLAGSAQVGMSRGWRAALGRWGAAQWAVTIGSVPMLLFFFQQFSLVSPLANALAIPLVSLLITPLALAFVVVPWTPLLAVDHWLLAQLMRVLEFIADWPLWQQPAPPWPAVLLGLAGVVWLLLPRGFPGRAAGLALLLPALFWPAPRPQPGAVWVDVLDVGQGLAVLVRTASHALLYDSGPAYSVDANAGQRVVVPYLRAVGVARIDTLVLSHRDQDHAGGYASVRAALPVDRLLTSIVALTGPPPLAGERCRAGQHWQWDGVHFAMLHPLADDYDVAGRRSNSMSCVLRVGGPAGDGAVLLTGDIEASDEQALRTRSPQSLRTALLVAPHHGGRASSTPAFVAAAQARDVVFSAGYRNAFAHPHPLVVERYAASRQWRTDRDGAVHAEWVAGAATVTAWRDERRRYWHGQ